jgi:hypothetical protein
MSLNIFDKESWNDNKTKLPNNLRVLRNYTNAKLAFVEVFNDSISWEDNEFDAAKEYIAKIFAKYRHNEQCINKVITSEALQLSIVLIMNINYMPAIDMIISNIHDHAEKYGIITSATLIDYFNTEFPSDNFFKPTLEIVELEINDLETETD